MGTVTVTAAGSIGSTSSSGGGGIAAGRTINASTTLALADANTEIHADHATVAIVGTIPNDATVAWPSEAVIGMRRGLAATISFAAGAGVTLRVPTGATNGAEQYDRVYAKRAGPNEWDILK